MRPESPTGRQWCGQCLAALADYMYNNDMRPDIAKVQNVTSYFIGFGADFSSGGAPTAAFNYLQAAASAGGGQAYTATDLTELTSAFNDILANVIKTNTTFAAPAVTVNAFNRTQTLDNLYVSVFSPTYHLSLAGQRQEVQVLQNGQSRRLARQPRPSAPRPASSPTPRKATGARYRRRFRCERGRCRQQPAAGRLAQGAHLHRCDLSGGPGTHDRRERHRHGPQPPRWGSAPC